ncbi:MAG: hypothetical protein SVO01_07595 [Thermotogota bacterium]|nr:hypothetical protein [Thermotogota bacterium]
MNRELHGKEIREVWWPDSRNEHGRHIKSNGYISISLNVTFCGDRTEAWIVEICNGEEIARHNPRYVESILWA